MGWFFLVFIILIAAFTLVAYGAGRAASIYVQRHIAGRLDQLNRIVNEKQVPEPWLKPYRRRAARLLASGAAGDRILKLEASARQRCLVELEHLRSYVTETGVAGSGETKQMIVEVLDEQAKLWRDDVAWHQLVDLSQPEPPVLVIEEPVDRQDDLTPEA